MMDKKVPIHVYSEIGKLETVILHRPGHEIENITPDSMRRLLFDDIPYLPVAQHEHDVFAETLKKNGAEVLYLEDLVVKALDTGGSEIKDQFVKQMLTESGYASGIVHDALKEYLLDFETKSMVNKIIEGVQKKEVNFVQKGLVSLSEEKNYQFFLDPMPNLYFTRDPQASIGEGLSINRMTFQARQRESLFMQTIINYHPRFANKKLHVWRDRNHSTHIEGGDELILNDHVLAIGISQRTQADAIEDIAHKLFKDSNYDTIITVLIPHNHAMMHLDTVFTMINLNQFTVHPGIMGAGGNIPIFVLHKDKDNQIRIENYHNLEAVLKDQLNLSELDLIPTGNGDPIVSAREQWNDGSNTLAIAPGVVVTYDRNYVSNATLKKHGIKVLEVPSSELSRGRGGPRCMTMPIYRDDIKK
ncbi:arginine deiminase [Oenococcus oeni]|uniref:Arginine deiminase n=1 Tax=Oenococcus oeni TaxID=1247 RepID=A0AAJ2UAP2_OENOE|nr:arginine deiminase [Oenococcus oeni]MDV7714485.1 arginine deiminase [Oenococcus oeni]OIK55949.1 arginine deiminase [Oenococcus oeni]OIM61882.1 arginine deiminase [Oenococcus oeni]